MSRVRIGLCGFADKTLLACGRFYAPDVARDPKRRLAFYATRFDLVEIDTSFYGIPAPDACAAWAEGTPADFVFDVKAYGLFTGHRTNPKSFPADVRAAIPADARERGGVYEHELPPDAVSEMYRRFDAAIDPLRRAGKLGVVLFQFPPWFSPTRTARDKLARVRAALPEAEIAVEFRNARWLTERERDRTLALLADHGLDYVCVDEPQGFASSVPPVVAVTGPTAVVRFHGRNRATWEAKTKTAAERMNWDYAEAELREWVPRLRELSAKAKRVHALMNNCHEDKAVRSAEKLAALLAERPA